MNSTIWIVLLVVVAVVAVIFLRKRKPAEDAEQAAAPPSDAGGVGTAVQPGYAGEPAKPAKPAKAGKESAPVSDDDKAVLQQLREAGSDLSKPHKIDFYLYFTAEEAAGKAAERLEAEGFEGEMRRAPDLTRWMCIVREQMVPEPSKIAASKRRLAKLAQEFGGEYDGWETDIEK